MKFEFDQEKSGVNKAKHGIDFDGARELWNDDEAIEYDVCTEPEPRFAVIGRIGSKHWTAIVTYRGDLIRIISVRRSRKEEVKCYEEDIDRRI